MRVAAEAMRIRLLGEVCLTYGDTPVTTINTPRLRGLLAFLVLHREAPQLRQRLAFLFWPDTSEAQARNNLRQILHELRHALPDADRFVTADARTVAWRADAPLALDVADFERALAEAAAAERADVERAALERAAATYRGDLLPGAYDDWIAGERQRLRAAHRRGLARLAALLEEAREIGAAIGHAERLLRDDPLDEEACRLAMRLLALGQDRAAAVRAYQATAAALRRELGVEPSAATRDAYERLLRDAPPAAQIPAAADGPPPLVGRQAEWQRLLAAWRQASAGAPGFALITGEPGIGKSRLAEELAVWARRQGLTVAAARSYAAEGRLSLAPVAEWLRGDALRAVLRRLDATWLAEVARIVPELRAERPDLPAAPPMTEYGQRQRFFDALARAVLAAPAPLLLLVDDLQWCDQETIEWLRFLLRFDPRARLLVVGTARDEELAAEHPLRALVRQLRAGRFVVELPLSPLDAAETAKLAAALGRPELDSDAAVRLFRETQGNPLFVVETVRAGADRARPAAPGLPPRIQAVIEARLAQLSPAARELAGVAAAIGRAFTLDLLRAIEPADEGALAERLDELWQRRIVRADGPNRYDFTHDRLREVAHAEIGAPRRDLLHRRIARALETLHADDLDAVAGEIAAHRERAGLARPAIDSYRRAATVAERLYANDDAIALRGRALALLDALPPGGQRDAEELDLQLGLARLYRVTKGWTSPEVERALERALELCDRVGGDPEREQVCQGLESLYVVQARLEKVQGVSDERHALHRRLHGTAPPAEAEMSLVGARLHRGHPAEADEQFERVLGGGDPSTFLRMAEQQGWSYAVHGRAWHAHALWLLGRPDSAWRRAHEAVALARDLGQPFNQALAATYLALLGQLALDAPAAAALADDALALTCELKTPYYRTWAAILVAHARAAARPGAAGIAGLREAIAAFRDTGARLRLPYYLGLLAGVTGAAGDPAGGLAAIDQAMAESRAHDERWWDAELHRLRGGLLLDAGADAADAEAAFRRSLAIARDQRARALELRAAISLARLGGTRRRRAAALTQLAEIVAQLSEGGDTPDRRAAAALLAER